MDVKMDLENAHVLCIHEYGYRANNVNVRNEHYYTTFRSYARTRSRTRTYALNQHTRTRPRLRTYSSKSCYAPTWYVLPPQPTPTDTPACDAPSACRFGNSTECDSTLGCVCLCSNVSVIPTAAAAAKWVACE